jgi:protein-L-isoaspartate(D-aspartate) O-methyltransferase
MAPPQPSDSGAGSTEEVDVRQFLERYVHQLKAEGAIRSPAVEGAFRRVERHRLLETFYHPPVEAPDFAVVHHDPEHPRPEHLELIYANTALATRVVDKFGARMPASSTSQPSLVAEMLELLELVPGLRMLEIGAGTGYNATLMAELVGDQRLVVSVDIQDDVVAQTRRLLARAGYPGISVLLRDGAEGAPERAPFDRIVATVGCSDLSPNWAEQLAEGGVMLVPLAHAGGHPLYLLHNEHGRLQGRVASWAAFMPARGLLHIDGLWPIGVVQPDAAEPIHQRDPWPGFGASGPLSLACSDDEIDLQLQSFYFYLSLHDRRACWVLGGVGLSDDLNGWAVAGPDGIRWWKNASLMEQLDRLHAGWLARGRPRIGDYRVAFVPISKDAAPPSGGWVLDRRFFRQLIWLQQP